jgi:hypothetical protein
MTPEQISELLRSLDGIRMALQWIAVLLLGLLLFKNMSSNR